LTGNEGTITADALLAFVLADQQLEGNSVSKTAKVLNNKDKRRVSFCEFF
jgi:hypothetical protein